VERALHPLDFDLAVRRQAHNRMDGRISLSEATRLLD
jgi:hypothetical protein